MPSSSKVKYMVAAVALAFSAHSQSETFMNMSFSVDDKAERFLKKGKVLPMDEGFWSFKGSIFECNLTLPMEDLGFLEIDHSAGSTLQMTYSPVEKRRNPPSIAWSSAPWHEDVQGHYYSMRDEADHFSLWSERTMEIMSALDQGGWLVFITGDKSYKVPSLSWSVHSNEFRECASELLPLSEDQVRDQVIYFELGQRTLNLKQLNKIRDIAKTINNVPNVSRILIDSYTDNTGSRLTNLMISRERSADVLSALKAAGISDNIKVEVRSHGERYPSTDNSTRRSKDKSRKVIIRVIKENEESYRK